MSVQPYAPRRIRYIGTREHANWSLKMYSITYGGAKLSVDEFESGLRLAEAELPPPDDTRGRPGLGLLIAHRGSTADYVVLGWWDRENELPLLVWVRDTDHAWRPGRDGESVCVWDLEVVWAERNAWVATMLSANGPNRAAYLATVEPRFHSR